MEHFLSVTQILNADLIQRAGISAGMKCTKVTCLDVGFWFSERSKGRSVIMYAAALIPVKSLFIFPLTSAS